MKTRPTLQSDRRQGSEGWWDWFADRGALCVAAVAMVVYLNSLPNGFTYDDVPVIVNNPATDPSNPWFEPWRRTWWNLGEWAGDADRPYRPLTVATFALERRLFGDRPLPFHLFNVLLHAANSVGVWWLARRVGAGATSALLAGVLFAVHPIHTEAVANIVGRAELLSTGGILLAVRLYDVHLRRSARGSTPELAHTGVREVAPATVGGCLILGSGSSWRVIGSFLGALLASGVAIFSKERGVAVVAVLAAWHVWAQIDLRRSGMEQQIPSRRKMWLGWLKPVAPVLLIVALYLWLRYDISGTLLFAGQRYGPDNPLREADVLARVLTPFALLGRYLFLMVWPARLLCNYSVNVLLPANTPVDGLFILGSLALVLAICVALTSLRNRPAWALSAFCFAAMYCLASNSVLLLETLFAERWFYGPAVWLLLMVALMFDRVREIVARRAYKLRPAMVTGCVALVLAGFALRTVLRNPDWRNNEVLFKGDLGRMDPGRRSAHLCYLVGNQQLRVGELESAEALLLEAASIFPDYPQYYQALGKTYLAMNRLGPAARWLERAFFLERRNTETQALLEIAQSRERGVDLLASLAAARQTARERQNDIDAVRRWAALAEKVDLPEAATAYRRLTQLAPDNPAGWNGLAYVLGNSGQIPEAVGVYHKMLARWPDNWEAHTNLATLLMNPADRQHHDPEKAIEHARRAVALKPGALQLQLNLAEVLAHCGRQTEAAELFEKLSNRSTTGSEQQRFYRERAAYLRGQ